PAPAGARLVGVERLGEIADAIADERQAVIVQIGDHHLADLTRRRWAAVLENLDDVAFADDVVTAMRLALVGDAAELARSVLVELLAAERLLDELAAAVGQRLRRRDDALGSRAQAPLLLEIGSEEVERLGVAVEQHRVVLFDAAHEVVHGRVAHFERRYET